MKYKNAKDILPDCLLRELQEYVAGGLIYVPQNGEKRAWGERSGARQYYKQRNGEIREAYRAGVSISDLAEKYALTEEAIRKILHIADAGENN